MKTIDEWIKEEQTPRSISLWGTVAQTDFVPELCSTIDGDGQQLIYFGTVNQRPRYWLMQIDSKHDIYSDKFYEIIEEKVITPLCEEFGETEWISEDDFDKYKSENNEDYEDYKSYEEYMDEMFEYPRLSIDGYHWGLIANTVTGETQ